MRTWLVKMAQVLNRSAEIEVEAMTEQEAIEKAEELVNAKPDYYWSDYELDDQFLEEIEEL
jgi:hypothetical protein